MRTGRIGSYCRIERIDRRANTVFGKRNASTRSLLHGRHDSVPRRTPEKLLRLQRNGGEKIRTSTEFIAAESDYDADKRTSKTGEVVDEAHVGRRNGVRFVSRSS